jgi:competence protein ComEC
MFVIFRPSPSLIYIAILLFIFSIPKIFRIGNIFRYLLIFISLLSVFYFSKKPDRYNPLSMEVFFLDVGQGDSEVVVFPGGDALLIDGGGSYFSEFEVGKPIVLPFLIQKKIDVRWVAVSHFHPDHCRGIIEIINILNPKELWISSFPVESVFLKELLKKMNRKTIIKRTDTSFYRSVGNCIIDQIFPEKILHTFYEHNNNSQVLKISDTKISFLFTGDIEKETERVLTTKVRKTLKSKILKVPHHGSKTSSTEDFLKMVSPEIAVISLSETNRFGFPHAEVLKRYKDLGIKVLRTSRRGGIKISSKNGKIVVKFSKYLNSHYLKIIN